MKISVVIVLLAGCSISRVHPNTVTSVCWDRQGRAHYQGDQGSTCAAKKFSWTKKVKTVYFDDQAGEYAVYRDSFDAALAFWNGQLDQQVFVSTNKPLLADITVQFGVDTGLQQAGYTTHSRNNGNLTSSVTIEQPGDIRLTYLYIAHELGHSGFGLGHDMEFRNRSIMNTAIGDMEGSKMNYWYAQQEDIEAIQAMLK